MSVLYSFFFFSSRRRHTRFDCDWSSDVCSSDLSEAHTYRGRASRLIVYRSQFAGTNKATALNFIVGAEIENIDRKSTRLNSSHSQISYAVFCLKKKKKTIIKLSICVIYIVSNDI